MAGSGGHKEINRTNITKEQAEEALERDIVKKQLELLHFRNTCQAFGFDAELEINENGSCLEFKWSKNGAEAVLKADFETYQYEVTSS